MKRINVVVVTLCGALTGCDIPPSELEVTRQQYMTAQKCAFRLVAKRFLK